MSTMLPKISLITAVYNNASTIEEAIKSVLAQNYPNLEYIIVDGGSSDGTLSLLENYRSHIHQLISERDKGIYDALNKGLRAVTGDIVGFLHSDDHFASTQVLHEIAKAFNSGSIDGVYSDLEYIRKEGDANSVLRVWKSSPFAPALLKNGWMPPHPTLYLKKEVYDSVGPFDLKYEIAADYDMVLRVFMRENLKFHYLPQVTVRMRAGGLSNRNLKRILQKSSEDYIIAKKAGLPALKTILRKNFSKIGQFLIKGPA